MYTIERALVRVEGTDSRFGRAEFVTIGSADFIRLTAWDNAVYLINVKHVIQVEELTEQRFNELKARYENMRDRNTS